MNKLLIHFINIVTIMGIFLGSIYIVAVDDSFYMNLYEKNNTQEVTKMSEYDLKGATITLIDYIKGNRDNLDYQGIVNGQIREIFDQREKEHMVDVKNLFFLLKKFLLGLILFGILGIAFIFYKYKGEGIKLLGREFFKSSFIFLIIIGVVVAIFIVNFNWFWIKFHELIFANDLWLLDPKVSIMINMFPLEFFYDCCFRIVSIFTGYIITLSIAGRVIFKRSFKA